MIKNILYFIAGVLIAYFGYSTIKSMVEKYMPKNSTLKPATETENSSTKK